MRTLILIGLTAFLYIVSAQNETTPAPSCRPDQFQCNNGDCIDGDWECDYLDDCDDGEDEEDCPCNEQCADGTCIPDGWTCDGYVDCDDNSDEKDCPCTDENQIKCPTEKGECIDPQWWCDSQEICDCNPGCVDQKNCSISSEPPTTTTTAMPALGRKQSNHNRQSQIAKLTKQNEKMRKILAKISKRDEKNKIKNKH